jgi:hypothetical protein
LARVRSRSDTSWRNFASRAFFGASFWRTILFPLLDGDAPVSRNSTFATVLPKKGEKYADDFGNESLSDPDPGGRYIGWCRAFGEPAHLPCATCLAGVP